LSYNSGIGKTRENLIWREAG